MAKSQPPFGERFSYPWWTRDVFRFSAPHGEYDPPEWRRAVLGHAMMQDLVAFLRHRISGPVPYFMQVHLNEQDQWYPLPSTLRVLDIEDPPDELFPLPQPGTTGREVTHAWLMSPDDQTIDEQSMEPIWVPLRLVATRLLPVSTRPIAQCVACWLAYRVLPVCARSGGPATWQGLDVLLSPMVEPL